MRSVSIVGSGVTGPAALASALVLALLAGASVGAASPSVTLAAIVSAGVIVAVAAHPPFGAYLLLAATPLLAGMERGVLLPLLRPHEALALLISAGIVLHLVTGVALRTPIRLRLYFGPVDRAILLMAVTSSVLPLMVMLWRERPIVQDDVLYALVLFKYYAVFVIVRACAATAAQVRTSLWVILGATAVVALVAIAQVLGVGAVESLLVRFYVLEGFNEVFNDRASSTLASPIAVGDVMVFGLAVAGGLLVCGDPRRLTLAGVAALMVLGTVATGQFSAIIALLLGVVAFGVITKKLGRSALALAPVAAVAAVALWPVISTRLSGFEGGSSLPQSWEARRQNVATEFWPVLQVDYNWLTGVRPLARVDGAAGSGIDFIWIESGYIYLLWAGGVAFTLAFLWFVWVALRSVARIAQSRDDAISAAAIASFTALVVMAILMTLDPHITIRGSADLNFALLALALVTRSSADRASPSGVSQAAHDPSRLDRGPRPGHTRAASRTADEVPR